jgi:hypothetical protein
MLYRIPMNVIKMLLEISIVPDDMVPKVRLPNGGFIS